MTSVLSATRALMRELGLTTMFGNPGSTEQPFLKHWPDDFTYVLALQEASAVAMADGYARITHRPVLVNLHTAAGVGNAMGNLMTAWHNKAPLVVTAGQQTREMMLLEPFLTNLEPTLLPKPYVKFALETARAEDAPAALLRAHAMAIQPPTGPVFLSVPLDDWDKPAGRPVTPRALSTRWPASDEALRPVAAALAAAANPALVLGAAVAPAFADGVACAETLVCAVYVEPFAGSAIFPEDHALFQGRLPPAIGPLGKMLAGHDLVVVVGAPVFRYYPYLPGDYLAEGTRLILVTDDPAEAARAPVGDTILADPGAALRVLAGLAPAPRWSPPAPRPTPGAPEAGKVGRMTPGQLFHALASVRPAHAVVVNETPSNIAALAAYWPVTEPDSYLFPTSGGLGYGLPAAVGAALAERQLGRNRPVVAFIGDGSLQYSIQALWTAARLALPVVIVVPDNREYAILKAFALLEDTPEVPGLDLPGLDIAQVARGYGCAAIDVATPADAVDAFREALGRAGPTVIVASIYTAPKPLM